MSPLPQISGTELIRRLEEHNLLGRGGAGFPLARKWRTVRDLGRGSAVVLANAAEGEPLSHKDRTLMSVRPHLVIDGALLAANAVGARDIIFYIGGEHRQAVASMRRALGQRPEPAARKARLVEAPEGYIAGEESAAVHYVNAGDARPTTTPPRPFERGVGGRSTLVQNVESLAIAALIARGVTSRTALATVSGAVARDGVYEIPTTSTAADVADLAGGLNREASAVLIGGYFGRWAAIDDVWGLPVDASSLRSRGFTYGCGTFYFLGAQSCGVEATARITTYLAAQSAHQCGPCVFGLGAIATATRRLADRSPQGDDLARITRWSGQLAGRGACKHPDGAVELLGSALNVFSDDFTAHQRRRCLARPAAARITTPVFEEAVA
jgi:NADH:ubiquinone oxidoreductase subunit F (NADH-binding)